MQSQRYKPSSRAGPGARYGERGDIVQVGLSSQSVHEESLPFLSDRTGPAQATAIATFHPGGWKGMEADVGVCHSFGGTPLYMHPLLCLYSLQQSYSPELPESCHCSPHWIPLDHFGLTTKPPQELQRALGRCSRPQTVLFMHPQSTFVTLCWGLFWSHYTSPNCTRVWSWQCLAVQELWWPWAGRPDLSCRNPDSFLGAKRSPLTSSTKAVSGWAHIHTECWVSLSSSAVPQVPLPWTCRDLSVSAGNEWRKTNNTHLMCKAETTSAYIFLSWNK